MNPIHVTTRILWAAALAAVVTLTGTTVATATEPCGDFGECKVLVEINSTDGDIGFHFLMDGDDLNAAVIRDPDGKLVFRDQAKLKVEILDLSFVAQGEGCSMLGHVG